MSILGAILGSLNGPGGALYLESHDSPSGITDEPYYDDQNGSGPTRVRRITKSFLCLKANLPAVLSALSVTDATNITTNGGRNADGSPATAADWGVGYLDGELRVSSFSPSFARVSAAYIIKSPAWVAAPGFKVTVTQENGIASVKYNGTTIKKWNSGTGSNGTGLRVVRLPAQFTYDKTTIKTPRGKTVAVKPGTWVHPLVLLMNEVEMEIWVAEWKIKNPEKSFWDLSAQHSAWKCSLVWVDTGAAVELQMTSSAIWLLGPAPQTLTVLRIKKP